MTGPRRRPTRREVLLAGVVALLSAAAGCDGPGTDRITANPSRAVSPAQLPRGPVRSGLLVFGDFGGGPVQAAVARAMERWAAAHRVDALVTTGDNVYPRGEPERFAAQLDEPYRRLRRTRPLWATLGNHDVADGHGAEQLRHLGLPDLPYTRSVPGLQLLFLDTTRVDGAQAAWLDARLSGPGPALRAVVFHHPAWSCGRHDSYQPVDRLWVPIIERHRVPLVLNGHDHNYQRFVSAGGVTYVVTGGGGRPLYRLDKACATGTPERVAGRVRHHFTAVEVRDRSLVVTVVAEDDTVLDRAVIRR
jgi:3',5'-cyclic AMP phosphodiesterase CpdA